jgi:hypothetical protein
MLELLFALMLACMPANYPTSAAVSSKVYNDAVVTVHADGSVSMVGAVALTERVLVCAVCDSIQDVAQDPQVSSLSTTWKSVDNTNHTVNTPIVSTTPSGLERAIILHTELVRQMKVIYPPAPNP